MTPRPTNCADCGMKLDAFGTCPQAKPEDAARMSAPVNCGRAPRQPFTRKESANHEHPNHVTA